LAAEDPDYIPEDLFVPAAPVESTTLQLVEEPFSALEPEPEPALEPEPELEPITSLTALTPRTIATLDLEPITEDPMYPAEEPAWTEASTPPEFKPFPIAPPLPPLPLPPTAASL